VDSTARPVCLLFLPYTYAGRGVPETAAMLAPGIASAGLDVRFYLPRARRPLPSVVTTNETLPFFLRVLRWRHVWKIALRTLEWRYARALRAADPSRTVAYFWGGYLPAPTAKLVRLARSLGIRTVREMPNTAAPTARAIMDGLVAQSSYVQGHNVTDTWVTHETAELPEHDYLFAPAPGVEDSLVAMGIDRQRILPTSYGWSRARFERPAAVQEPSGLWPLPGLRVLYVGFVCVRKGAPELIAAWQQTGLEGELLFVGDLDPGLQPLLEANATAKVRHIPFSDDLPGIYRSADVFVLPTHEEGAPQVTYEAAACGLPIITTPMGAARLVETGVNGTVIPAGDVDLLAAAISEMAADPQRRAELGAAAKVAAERFDYDTVGRRSGEMLRRIALHQDPVAASKAV
jgi:glycosyltransferase involved in cell wall biosynthesis